MVKIALFVLALVAVAAAKPLGGAVVTKNHHVTSSVVSPYLGYGMLGLGGIGGIGHTVSTHSIGHIMPHYGIGMLGMKGLYGGLYPGIGLGGLYGGYGLMG